MPYGDFLTKAAAAYPSGLNKALAAELVDKARAAMRKPGPCPAKDVAPQPPQHNINNIGNAYPLGDSGDRQLAAAAPARRVVAPRPQLCQLLQAEWCGGVLVEA